MAAIVLRGFGGMAPSANAKAMPDTVATLAQNLNLRYGDFRPMPQPANIGAAAAGSTLYKFETSGGFITKPGLVNFVRGQIPTDATERTYYTGEGVPKVMTKDGAVRQLGVPAPAAAPLVLVNLTTQYSTDDAAKDQGKKQQEMIDAIKANYSWPFLGLTDADLAARFEPTDPAAPWSYSLKIPGTMVNGAFVPTNPSHTNLIDDRLLFNLKDKGGGVIIGRVNLDVRGQKIVLNTAGMAAALTAIADPSDSTGTKKMLAPDQLQTIQTTMVDALKPLDATYDAAIVRLRDLLTQFVALADTGSATAAANIGTVKAFYQKPATTAAINSAVSQAVSAIYAAMFTYNNAAYTSQPATGGSTGNPKYYYNGA